MESSQWAFQGSEEGGERCGRYIKIPASCCSKWGSWPSSIGSNWELLRNTAPWVLPRPAGPESAFQHDPQVICVHRVFEAWIQLIFVYKLFMTFLLVFFSLIPVWVWVLWESNAKWGFEGEKCLCRIKGEAGGKGKESLQSMMQAWHLGKERGEGGGLGRKSFRLPCISVVQPHSWGDQAKVAC